MASVSESVSESDSEISEPVLQRTTHTDVSVSDGVTALILLDQRYLSDVNKMNEVFNARIDTFINVYKREIETAKRTHTHALTRIAKKRM